jgi:hypothetical protein
MTASEELLILCCQIFDGMKDEHKALILYMKAEHLYMQGDATDIFEFYQTIKEFQLRQRQLNLL